MDKDELDCLRGPLSPNAVSIIETGMHEEGQYIMQHLRELPPKCGIDVHCREAADRLLSQMSQLFTEQEMCHGGGHIQALGQLIAWIRQGGFGHVVGLEHYIHAHAAAKDDLLRALH